MSRLTYKLKNPANNGFKYIGVNGANAQKVLSKLGELEDLEEQGLLLKLPYPLETEKLYFVWDYEIYELKAKEITVFKAGILAKRPHEIVFTIDCYDFFYDDFGKTVFLTKEEAEKALAEMEK